MKNQYVGDVGDYGNQSLLRAFSEAGVKVGINWYLTEDDGSNDGKHISYLEKEDIRRYDPVVFDAMKKIIDGGNRSVQAVQDAEIIKNALYFDASLRYREIRQKKNISEQHGSTKAWMRWQVLI